MKLLFVAIAGFVVAIGVESAYAQVSTANPSWVPSGSRSYEESFPGLGSSHHFSSSYGSIDVYSYGRKRSDWSPGTDDPQFAAEFSRVLAEIRQAAAQGITSNLVIGATRDVRIAGQQFRTTTLSFDRGNQSFDSAVHLTAKDGQLLKYRTSARAKSEPGVAQLAEQFIASDLPSRRSQPVQRTGSPQSAVGSARDPSSPRFAKSTTCQVRGDPTAPVMVSWDTETKKARAVFALLGPAEGTVELVRSRKSPSDTVNLKVKPLKFPFADEVEVLIFQVAEGQPRVIAVGYQYVEGQKYLSSMHGNSEATCQ